MATIKTSETAGTDAEESRGWYSRSYLPHFDQPNLLQTISFRLHDSVPPPVVLGWKEELGWRAGLSSETPAVVSLRRRIVDYEDAGYGACWLGCRGIAGLVENALLHFDGARYRLIAWCIMPNHVHVLIETFDGHPIGRVLHSWKSFTALRANQALARDGDFWARDFYDRFVRDERHLLQAIGYIEQNPVKAGLVTAPEKWPHSSATHRG